MDITIAGILLLIIVAIILIISIIKERFEDPFKK